MQPEVIYRWGQVTYLLPGPIRNSDFEVRERSCQRHPRIISDGRETNLLTRE
jgi:hypothetical protein